MYLYVDHPLPFRHHSQPHTGSERHATIALSIKRQQANDPTRNCLVTRHVGIETKHCGRGFMWWLLLWQHVVGIAASCASQSRTECPCQVNCLPRLDAIVSNPTQDLGTQQHRSFRSLGDQSSCFCEEPLQPTGPQATFLTPITGKSRTERSVAIY